VISRIEQFHNAHGIKKIRKFIFLYRAIFFILGLAGISLIGVVALFNMANTSNIDYMTETAINHSARAFDNLENNTVNMLSAAIEGLMINKEMAQAFLNRDQDKLLRLTRPLLDHFKENNGITHWYFITLEKTCFLRIHSPGLNGDAITRFTLDKCAETKRFSVGKELGKTALALRAVHPYYYEDRLIGFMELAIDLDYLFTRLRTHTRSEYGLLVNKKFLDYAKWKSVTSQKGIRDNWNDMPHHLLVNQTSDVVKRGIQPESFTDPESIGDRGMVLAKITDSDSHFIRGVFPFYDAAGRKVGGMFLLSNITGPINAVHMHKHRILWMLTGFMGLVTFFMLFFHKRAESEMRRYRSRLEDMVDETTAEIRETNRKLNLEIEEHKIIGRALEEECKAREAAEKKQIRAVKQAERAARMASIGVMAAGITHEINQPLNAIKVTADSVQFWHKRHPGMLPQTLAEQLELISKSVKRIVEIVQHMRAFWVLPDTPAISEIDLNEAVKNALSLTRQQLHSHGIKNEMNLSREPVLIEGNLIHFEQIIINLVVNAIHALDQKSANHKQLEFTSNLDKNENRAVLVISDNGPGLPPGHIDKIFDPFFSTNTSGGGMGLGLAIVKKYVDRYNGSIKAGNITNNGSVTGARFTLTFPFKLESKEMST
jgi:signal transduction histidine kinase